jgi:hypothetical protein
MTDHRPAAMDIRNGLQAPPDAQVRVVFIDEARVPVFECEPCEELMRFSEEVWVCPQCEYELTPHDAVELLDLAIQRLWLIRDDVGKKVGGRWWQRAGRWFALILLRWSS